MMTTEAETVNSKNESVVYNKEYFNKRLHEDDLNNTLTLKSGRQVSYGEAGKKDGYPVLFFPGLGGSRQFLALFEKVAENNGLRLISPDRPGTGLSDDVHENSEKQPLPWADIVEEIADQLNIEKFGLLAQSCGTIYALACAIKIPHRVAGVIHIISPWVSLSTPGSKGSLKAAQWAPGFLVGATSSVMATIPQMAMSMGSMSVITKGWSNNEKTYYDSMFKPFFEEFLQMSRQENRSGFTSAVMVCLEKYGPWGFAYEDVSLPVHFFQGDKDTMVPQAAAEASASAMQKCQISIYSDATHNLMMDLDNLDGIFKSLVNSLSADGGIAKSAYNLL